MAYRNRSTSLTRDQLRGDDRDLNPYDRRYGEDLRGDTRGYNPNPDPYYRTEPDDRYTGYNPRWDENYGRVSSPNWASSNENRWETTRGFTESGPRRSHLRCRDLMTTTVASCRRKTPIQESARIMRDQDIGALPVLDDNGKLAGIVTDRDLVIRGLTSDKAETEVLAEDCMSDDVYTANQHDRVVKVIREMGDHQVRRIPVVDSRNRLVGIIATADIALHTNHDRELADVLESISKPSSWLGRLAHFFNW